MRPTSSSTAILRHSFTRSVPRNPLGARYNSTSEKTQNTMAGAQKVAGKAWESMSRFLGPVGHRLGNLLGGYKEPLVYNFAVAREVAKRIYTTEALHPPSLNQVTTAYRQLWSNATQLAHWRELVQSGQIVQVGVYGLQAYGIFKIGEILGRRHLVGYQVQ